MKPRFSNQRNHALTLVEVLVVIAMLAVLAAMLLPTGPYAGRKAFQINCVNNLKEIGFAYKLWAGDHNDKLPMEVSVTNGGTMELVADGKNAWLNFLIMSNELSTPKILYCYADEDHVRATNFLSELKGKISYFVGLSANTNYPQAFLSGDDNFEISGIPVKSGLLEISTNTPITWSAARHKLAGNIGLADGSVWQTDDNQLVQKLIGTGLATNRLAIP